MINIDEVCEDEDAKYYAAVLYDNAAVPLFAETTRPAIETPYGSLVAYNVYRTDSYKEMEADPLLPDSIKSELKKKNPNLGAEFTSPDLKGWHVVRTPTSLAGEQLRRTLTEIQETLNTPFYSKSLEQFGMVRDCLVREEVYKI